MLKFAKFVFGRGYSSYLARGAHERGALGLLVCWPDRNG